MDHPYWINYIIADYTPFDFGGRFFYLSSPTREAKFLAERVYHEVFKEAIDEGLLTDTEIAKMLVRHSLWSDEKEELLEKLYKDIEDIKLQIFENFAFSGKRDKCRELLKGTLDYIGQLTVEKSTFDTYGAKSVAVYAKQHYLIGQSIFVQSTKKLAYKSRNWWSANADDIIQHAYKVLSDYIITDNEYRELAQSNYWRNIWVARKSNGSLFGRPTVSLSTAQQQLITWSNLYDSVYKHSECPADEVIEDPDALDGWMIKQRRNRESETNKNSIERSIKSEKIRNSDEIYIMCDAKDAAKVYECNDLAGKMRWKSIMSQVQKEGYVPHMKLKDTQAEIARRAMERMG